MAARLVRESYGGGSIAVETENGERPFADPAAYGRIRVEAFARGSDPVVLHLTPAEAADLVAALNATLVETPASSAAIVDQNLRRMGSAGLASDTPRSLGGELNQSRRCASGDHDNCRGQWTAYPDQGGPCECPHHTQTAPVGAGAAPTGETSPTALVDDPGGHTRTQATGLSDPPAEPGRPISHHDGPDGVWCKWSGCLSRTGACPEGHELPGYVVEAAAPATSILSGLSIAAITAARLAADPASAEVPFEVGGALHVADRCGCSDCETAFARQFARSVAAADARGELQTNNPAVTP